MHIQTKSEDLKDEGSSGKEDRRRKTDTDKKKKKEDIPHDDNASSSDSNDRKGNGNWEFFMRESNQEATQDFGLNITYYFKF